MARHIMIDDFKSSDTIAGPIFAFTKFFANFKVVITEKIRTE